MRTAEPLAAIPFELSWCGGTLCPAATFTRSVCTGAGNRSDWTGSPLLKRTVLALGRTSPSSAYPELFADTKYAFRSGAALADAKH